MSNTIGLEAQYCLNNCRDLYCMLRETNFYTFILYYIKKKKQKLPLPYSVHHFKYTVKLLKTTKR